MLLLRFAERRSVRCLEMNVMSWDDLWDWYDEDFDKDKTDLNDDYDEDWDEDYPGLEEE
jgi:hypothetical protein